MATGVENGAVDSVILKQKRNLLNNGINKPEMNGKANHFKNGYVKNSLCKQNGVSNSIKCI